MTLTVYRPDGTVKASDYATTPAPLDKWHNVGDPGEPAFQNGWINLAGGWTQLSFRKSPDGRVAVRGTVGKGGGGFNANEVIFTLPPGYRPPANLIFNGRCAGTTGGDVVNRMDLMTDGRVIVITGGAANPASYLSIPDWEFDTESVSALTVPVAAPMAATLDPWHVVGGVGEPALQNGWVAYGAPFGSARFRKFPDGKVRLSGMLKTGANGTAAFVLPAGYRPPTALQVAVTANTADTTVQIDADGSVRPVNQTTGNVTASVSLDGIEFDTETVTQWVVPVAMPTPPVVPDVKFYGDIGTTADVPAGGWDVTHADGSAVFFTLAPPIDCWWPTSANVLAKTTSAVWCRLQLDLTLTPADVDAHNIACGSIMCHAGGSDWNEGNVQRAWKLAKNVTYTLKLHVTPVGGTFQMYRHNNHLWLAHDGIIPR